MDAVDYNGISRNYHLMPKKFTWNDRFCFRCGILNCSQTWPMHSGKTSINSNMGKPWELNFVYEHKTTWLLCFTSILILLASWKTDTISLYVWIVLSTNHWLGRTNCNKQIFKLLNFVVLFCLHVKSMPRQMNPDRKMSVINLEGHHNNRHNNLDKMTKGIFGIKPRYNKIDSYFLLAIVLLITMFCHEKGMSSENWSMSEKI